MKTNFLFLLLISFPCFMSAEQAKTLSFNDLKKGEWLQEYENQPLLMRGFLYQNNAGELILTDEPNLKSCCLGSQNKSDRQIKIYGSFQELPLNGMAVSVQGNFKIENKILPVYALHNAVYVENSKNSTFFIITCLFAIFTWLTLKISKKATIHL